MLSALKAINLADFPAETRDPGTGWPRWRYIRQSKNPWLTQLKQLSETEQIQIEGEALARIIADLMQKFSHEGRIRALELLANEHMDVEDPEAAVSFLGDIVRPHGIVVEHVLSQ